MARKKTVDAKIIKLADKTSKLRAITFSPAPRWSVKSSLSISNANAPAAGHCNKDPAPKTAGASARLLGTMAMLGGFETVESAMRWFELADSKGGSIAMVIASVYAKGQGVVKNCDLARYWIQKAIAAGYENANGELRSGFNGQCHR